MSDHQETVAVGLQARSDVIMLRQSNRRLWPVDETPCFDELLAAIDHADRETMGKPATLVDDEKAA